MSIEVMSKVLAYRGGELNATQRFVLTVLADHADKDGNNAYPSVGRIVEETSLSERAVQGAIKSLLSLGFIKRSCDGKGNVKGRGSKYRIDIDRLSCPRRKRTPAGNAPPQEMRSAPAGDAPEPSLTINNKSNNARAREATDDLVELDPDSIPPDCLAKAIEVGWGEDRARAEWERFAYHHADKGTVPTIHPKTKRQTWAQHWATWRKNTQRFEERDNANNSHFNQSNLRTARGGTASDGFLRFFAERDGGEGGGGAMGGHPKERPRNSGNVIDIASRDFAGRPG